MVVVCSAGCHFNVTIINVPMVKQYWYLLKHSSFNCHYWCLAWGSLSSVYLDRSEVLMNCLGFTLNMYINIYSVLGWTCPMYNNTVNNKYQAVIMGSHVTSPSQNQSVEAILTPHVYYSNSVWSCHNAQCSACMCTHFKWTVLYGPHCLCEVLRL